MAQFDKETYEIVKRIQRVRLKLLKEQPFYAMLLMHMKFSLDVAASTAYTDGERVAFNIDFLKDLTDRNLEFVMMHEILHVALQHVFRTPADWNMDAANIAADIIVNSNILQSANNDLSFITLPGYGEAIHKMPNGKEGYLYSLEEAYKMILADSSGGDQKGDDPIAAVICDCGQDGGGLGSDDFISDKQNGNSGFDDHTFWQVDDEDNSQSLTWLNRMIDATDIVAQIEQFTSEGSKNSGGIPMGVERMVKEYREPQTDWRVILNDFIQEEINDYSFAPPDRRMQDSDFFLPDFNEKTDKVENVLFMIDTSGSMSDEMITQAYSEIKGGIEQFDGRLKGWLGFFDAEVYNVSPFETIEEFEIIRPVGGGGTSFSPIFNYVREKMEDDPPVSIIILTDGYAPFPEEKQTMKIPVLWLINNEDVTPPWGKIARIKVNEPKGGRI